jgi:hypothetical protein
VRFRLSHVVVHKTGSAEPLEFIFQGLESNEIVPATVSCWYLPIYFLYRRQIVNLSSSVRRVCHKWERVPCFLSIAK